MLIDHPVPHHSARTADEVAGVTHVTPDLDTRYVQVDGTVDRPGLAAGADSVTERRGGGMSASTKHFVRHYVEMVVAMFAGMAILGVPAGWLLGALGSSWSQLNDDAPALMFLGMATTMTVPMIGWMAHRGHGRRANAEMSASMFAPTFAVIGLLWAGLVSDIGVLLIVEHVAMLAGMLAVMLLRPDEYTHHHHDTHAHIERARVPA